MIHQFTHTNFYAFIKKNQINNASLGKFKLHYEALNRGCSCKKEQRLQNLKEAFQAIELTDNEKNLIKSKIGNPDGFDITFGIITLNF